MADTDNATLQEPPHHEILTKRLKLRTLRVSDAARLMPILTSQDVMQWTTRPPVQDLPQAERWIKDRALGQDVFNFIIELRDPDSISTTRNAEVEEATEPPIIGIAGTFHLPKVGYLIHPSYWGHGIASEALSAIVSAIFARFPSTRELDGGLDYVEGWIDVDNAPSKRVLEKCGFRVCEEVHAPPDAPGCVGRVAVLRRAREGLRLEEMGMVGGNSEERGFEPPVQ